MVAPLTLYILRHGEVHNPQDILYGRLPNFRLSTTGREQAQAAGRFLSDKTIHAIYTSPMQRAQETAALIAQEHQSSFDIQIDECINECLTPFEGQAHADLQKINFDVYTGNQAPYEMPRDLRKRLLAFITNMRKKHANQTIIAVTHGDIVVSAFMYAKQQAPDDIGRSRTQIGRLQALGLPEPYPATASVSQLLFISDDPDEIPTYNYTCPY